MNRISLLLCLIGIIHCQFNTVLGRPDSNRQPKLINGYPASPNQFPYLVSVYQTNSKHYCGGGIIADQYILTAAHCIIDHETNETFGLAMEIVVDTVKSVQNTGNRIAVQKAYVLKKYEYPSQAYDIGILKLSESLQLSDNPQRRKLDLPKVGIDYTDRYAVIAGFGITDAYDFRTLGQQLFYSTARIISNKDCKEDHDSRRLKFNVTENHICAKITQTYSGVSAGICNGDSGSPLVVDGNTVVGVTSTSAPACNERRGASRYTRVTKYLSFIQAVVTGQLNDEIVEYNVPPPPVYDP